MRSIRIVVAFILLLALALTVQAVVTLNIYVEDTEGSRMSDAAIYVGESYIGVTNSDGWLSYTHPGAENYNLRVSKTGYESRTLTIQKAETSRTVVLSRNSMVLTVLVYDENVAPLRSAIVRVVGPSLEKTEQTGSNGKAIFTLSDGQAYQVFITALDYRDAETSVQLSGTSREISVVMERGDRFAFRITDEETGSPVQGAEIMVDGVLRGTTRDDGIFSYNLRKGYEYLISVKKPEYEDYSMRQYITGDQQVLSISLSKAYYTPFISVFDPAKKIVDGADVYLNGMLLRKTDNYGRASLDRLTAGTYLLEIRKAGFEPYSQEITISEESIDFIANLAYSSVLVRVLVQDESYSVISGASISVDGVYKGTTDASGILSMTLTPGSEYTLTASRDGYHEGVVNHGVPTDGQQDSVTITLKPQFNLFLVGGVILAVLILGGGIYLFKKRGRKGTSRTRFKDW
ncbi:carboxypeptidase regulatory-like domain-containing protein [Methanocalculus taiwanensis]|uniref:Carboxypeptidase regulatory-like domain-containing protein n=1 Tax=Methanocalculus taiwanensis TaxID=106207 RepID=A0ABD4TN27_9EURY|nr:carboxypeptidase-like regulatory domain-containing protein [Methanocalculus taiwanensis]MCQ1538700.1 carboxypeptidase regulatory-like domain-containing protein [Methanocalculus taiwanensis]